MGARYIRLSVKQAKHFLEEANTSLDMKCPDTQTDAEESRRNAMIDVLASKINRALREA
jgi:hypothetical protein